MRTRSSSADTPSDTALECRHTVANVLKRSATGVDRSTSHSSNSVSDDSDDAKEEEESWGLDWSCAAAGDDDRYPSLAHAPESSPSAVRPFARERRQSNEGHSEGLIIEDGSAKESRGSMNDEEEEGEKPGVAGVACGDA